jgi:hypothetical protein
VRQKSFSPKLDAALEMLATTGIWRSNYAPPMHRLLWRVGISIPPPHFMSFGYILLYGGLCVGVLLGASPWVVGCSRVFPFRSNPDATPLLLWMIVIACSFFGLGMAAYYQYGKRQYKLPSWSEVRGKADNVI